MSRWTCFNGLYLVKKSASRADTSASGSGIKKENISNKKLAKELSKTTIRKFEKSKVHSTFIEIFGKLILLICN